ncbi:low choriolytic enzyme-like isoform X1 [Daktulosphaira vitifoliae]|uniref:low choriolytic enzyme-like isoform X1 n=1 Tax=Daktulosphaira vitifoliae TaxID=58002 RepID=UPI0021AA4A8B|nr:low choriolytic enzyme-like isoform X1 [Daktulosphaira vitifoliae]
MIGLVLLAYMITKLLSCCEAQIDGKTLGLYYEKIKENLKPSHLSPDTYPELKSELYQGDILLPVTRNAIISEYYKWPKGIIPYILSPNIMPEDRLKIRNAMDFLESKTCLKFTDKNDNKSTNKINIGHNEYLSIQSEKSKGCYAMIGYHENYGMPHKMNLESPACLTSQGTIQHELLHVVGLLHEQARYDRDNAVIIYWENIDKVYWQDFGKVPENVTTTFGLPYDYTSVMHYPRYAFSKNGLETIVAKYDQSMALGQRNGATSTDIQKVNLMYNCSGTSSYISSTTSYLTNKFKVF